MGVPRFDIHGEYASPYIAAPFDSGSNMLLLIITNYNRIEIMSKKANLSMAEFIREAAAEWALIPKGRTLD
jgi:hypothetical protein